MSSQFRFELNKAGVRELLREDMKPIIEAKAREIADRCGDGYESDIYTGENRCNAMVWADTPEAIIDNEQNNTILGALR